MEQARAEDTAADVDGNSLNIPYDPSHPKRIVRYIANHTSVPEALVTYPSGEGPIQTSRIEDGRIIKSRVKDPPPPRRNITPEDHPGNEIPDNQLLIEHSISKLTKEQQDYIRPYVLPPLNIVTTQFGIEPNPDPTRDYDDQPFPKSFGNFDDYLEWAAEMKGKPINQDHDYFSTITLSRKHEAGHVEAIRFNPVRKTVTVFATTPEENTPFQYLTERFFNGRLRRSPRFAYKIRFERMSQQNSVHDTGCGLYAATNLMAAIKNKPRQRGHTPQKIERVKNIKKGREALEPPYPRLIRVPETDADVEEWKERKKNYFKTLQEKYKPLYQMNEPFNTFMAFKGHIVQSHVQEGERIVKKVIQNPIRESTPRKRRK